MDKKEALKIVKNRGTDIISLPEKFIKDREVVLEAVKNNGISLFDATVDDKTFLKDREIVLEAVKSYGKALIDADVDKSFLKDKEIVFAALNSMHAIEAGVDYILDNIDESLQNDEDIRDWYEARY